MECEYRSYAQLINNYPDSDRFRWVALQLDAVSTCRTINHLSETLKTLPPTLDETYARILQRIDEYEQPFIRLILQWVCFSVRSLTPEALAEIHRVGGNIRPSSGPHNALFQAEDILGLCPGFLIFTKDDRDEHDEVHLAHFSVKEYLVSHRASPWGFNENESHIAIVRGSIAYYLDVVRQEKQDTRSLPLSDYIHKYPLLNYATSNISSHLDSVTPREHPDLTESFHTLFDPTTSALSVHGLGACFLIDNDLWEQKVCIEHPGDTAETLSLVVAVTLGLSSAIRWLISFDEIRGCIQSHSTVTWYYDHSFFFIPGETWPLLSASSRGYSDLVQLLIEKGADVNLTGGDGTSALSGACTEGQFEVVKLLLEAGANPNLGSALVFACREMSEDIVHALLDADAHVDYTGSDSDDGTALHASVWTTKASGIGDSRARIVRMLLDAGADPNHSGGRHGSILAGAAHHGDPKIVRMLLNAGADVKGCHESALSAASFMGHEEIVRMLLNAGADVNSDCGGIRCALQCASYQGHEQIVQLLLQAGADVNQECAKYGSALDAAISRRRPEIADLLIAAGARFKESMFHLYDTAFYEASLLGNINMIYVLLVAGFDPFATSIEGYSALQRAILSGDVDRVRILLRCDVDVNQKCRGPDGCALATASRIGHELIVQVLLDAGANVYQRGGEYGSVLGAAYEGDIYCSDQIIDSEGDEFDSALGATYEGGKEDIFDSDPLTGSEWDASKLGMVAYKVGNQTVIQMLLDAGADQIGEVLVGQFWRMVETDSDIYESAEMSSYWSIELNADTITHHASSFLCSSNHYLDNGSTLGQLVSIVFQIFYDIVVYIVLYEHLLK
jgi:ankyrin repeat protein